MPTFITPVTFKKLRQAKMFETTDQTGSTGLQGKEKQEQTKKRFINVNI
jgi:hypothetical protein